MIEASEATTPAALLEFQNSDLGEAFLPPGGGVSVDVLDRCREDGVEEYAGQPCEMGVDVGFKLHVVVREARKRRDENEDEGRPAHLWFVAELDTFQELDGLMNRFNVERCVIDAQPETRLAREFAVRHRRRVWLARYDRREPGHERVRGRGHEASICHVNRAEALDEMFERFRRRVVTLPLNARGLGGRVKEGLGEYYRQLLTPKRTLEQDGQGNWVARWVDNGRADHYAHAEVYCLLASWRPPRPGIMSV